MFVSDRVMPPLANFLMGESPIADSATSEILARFRLVNSDVMEN